MYVYKEILVIPCIEIMIKRLEIIILTMPPSAYVCHTCPAFSEKHYTPDRINLPH